MYARSPKTMPTIKAHCVVFLKIFDESQYSRQFQVKKLEVSLSYASFVPSLITTAYRASKLVPLAMLDQFPPTVGASPKFQRSTRGAQIEIFEGF